MIQARIEAATPGPWTRSDYVDIDQDGAFDLAHVTAPDPHDPDTAVQGIAMGILREDAEFIAHAREDVPRLLDALAAVETTAKYLDTLADGDKHYAKLFRDAVARGLGGAA